jgi:CRISPR/Cas system-associated exonuclease Cas4 (RecB family)
MAPQITRAQAQMMAVRDEGLAMLTRPVSEGGLGVPQEAIDSVAKLGTRITELRSDAEDLQLGFEQAQYNEQLRVSVRTIGDLVALTGQQRDAVDGQTVAATKYGQLQRAQIMDGRELTRIQLARSQRELNLSVALSRLQAPGETAEERAVRRDEAMLLAREQQRELDIGKRTATRGFAIEDIGFGRQLTDAAKQLGLLQQGRAVSIEVRGIQKAIEAKEQLLQLKQAYLEVPKEAGIALRRSAIQITETVETVLGKLTDEEVEAIDKFVRRTSLSLRGLLSFGSATSEDTPRRQGWAGTRGLSPSMNGASSGSGMGGGGGRSGHNININVHASVRNDGDVDLLTRRVMKEINQQAALVGG